MVLLARESSSRGSEAALNELCRAYWYPLYAYVRRQGHGSHDAQDLTQEFFARLLAGEYLKIASQERGRFRSLLLKSLQHFLINDWVRSRAQKRGSGQRLVPLDDEIAEGAYQRESPSPLSPERLYDRRWAMTLLEKAMDRLDAECAVAGKRALFEQLKPVLLTEGSAESYRTLAAPLGLSEGAVKVAVHRLRQRFREAVRAEIALTVATPEEVDLELRCLTAAMIG